MRVQGTSSATVLMLIVLAVMAVIGVFGLPQFAPVIASPDDVASNQLSDSTASYRQAGAGESTAQGVEDLFAPAEATGETEPSLEQLSFEKDAFRPLDVERLQERAASDRQIVDLIGKPSADSPDLFDDNEPGPLSIRGRDTNRDVPRNSARVRVSRADEYLDQQFATANPRVERLRERSSRHKFDSRFGRRDRRQTSATAEVGDRAPFRRTLPADDNEANRVEISHAADREPMTWRAAVGRLNSLGIRHYQLSAGTRPNEFHFSCFFTPADNPRITHRFEAEASEPLHAVQRVLTQIDHWQSGRENPSTTVSRDSTTTDVENKAESRVGKTETDNQHRPRSPFRF